jgi:hypothetical protein
VVVVVVVVVFVVVDYLRLCQVFSNSQSTVCEPNTFWEIASGKY